MSDEPKMTDDRIRWLAGNLLRAGVLLAALIVAIGGAVYLVRHGGERANVALFHNEPAKYKIVSGILATAADGQGRGLIQLGLLLLIATPVVQVAASIVGFALEGDRRYVVIGLIVLGCLVYSLVFGRV